MIDTSMEDEESQGKKTVALMLSISHHITLMILATLLVRLLKESLLLGFGHIKVYVLQ